MNPAAALQPQDRSIRYSDIHSAMAEEGVIRLLTRDDTLFPLCAQLRAEEFSSPLLGKIYQILSEDHSAGLTTSINALAGVLTAEEMSHLTDLLQRPESLQNSRQALSDYIAVIHGSWQKRSGTETIDPLLAAQEKAKIKKGYGGKQQ